MKAWIWLRAASIVFLLFALGHGLGHLRMGSHPPPEAAPVYAAMKTVSFQVEGLTRNVWDFYSGFSLVSFFSVFMLGVIVWQLGNLARTQPKVVRPIVVAILIGQVFCTIVCWTDFIYPPAILSTLATLFLAAAAFGL
jgi:hypothetical protein